METLEQHYLSNIKSLFGYYRSLGEKALAQVSDHDINRTLGVETNSIAIIVKHLRGNMLSRFTDFLTSDGEKPWRQREEEFAGGYGNKESLMNAWSEGWDLFMRTLNELTDEDLLKIVYIRNEGHTVIEALNRQLGHYAYHIGQLVLLCRHFVGEEHWVSLSIPKGGSQQFNQEKFNEEKGRRNFV